MQRVEERKKKREIRQAQWESYKSAEPTEGSEDPEGYYQ